MTQQKQRFYFKSHIEHRLINIFVWYGIYMRAGICSTFLFYFFILIEMGGCVFRGSESPVAATSNKKSSISFPADHLNHPGVLTEWWYFNGHLEAPGKKSFTYGFCLFRASPVLYFAHLSLTDQEENHFAFDRILYSGGETDMDRKKRRISFNDHQVLIQKRDHDFHIKGSWPGCELDLELNTQKPPMIINGSGKVNMPEGGESSYYSLTRLQTTGTIGSGKNKYTVTGLSWMDHQWGNFFVRNKGWDWFSFQMEDSSEYNLYSFRDRSGKILHQYVNMLDHKNNLYSYHSFVINPRKYWTNKTTGHRYATEWKLILPDTKDTFLLVAQTENQEIFGHDSRDIFPSYWEGSCIVEQHTNTGKTVYGRGFSEQFPLNRKSEKK